MFVIVLLSLLNETNCFTIHMYFNLKPKLISYSFSLVSKSYNKEKVDENKVVINEEAQLTTLAWVWVDYLGQIS